MRVHQSFLSSLWCVALATAQSNTERSLAAEAPRLNYLSSSPHVFASTFGLLQQWSNTFMPYGHSIVPCEVPVNTNLYHARINSELPPSPEWLAFDATMSYMIAGIWNTSYMLTYRTTRNVKCIYFDGSSASLNGAGNMDSQMVLIHNNSANVPDGPRFGRPPNNNNRTSGDPNGGMLGDEYDRAEGLCAYIRNNNLGGRGWGYEGIVRMNAGFEMIWCDFESPSLRRVSRIKSHMPTFEDEVKEEGDAPRETRRHVLEGQRLGQSSPQSPLAMVDGPPGRPRFRVPRFFGSAIIGWLTASTNQYGFADGGRPGRGEVRVRPDSCAIWSFYDVGLVEQERARRTEESKALNLSSAGIWEPPTNETERQLALQQIGRRRRSHRANHLSTGDGLYMLQAVERRLRTSLNPRNDCSGIDWHLVAEEIVLEYSSNLKRLIDFLNAAPSNQEMNHTETKRWISPVREVSHIMMMPYYEYPSGSEIKSSPEEAFGLHTRHSQAAYQRCLDQYLPLISGDIADSERAIYAATTDVLEGICRVVLTTFLSIETVWYTMFEQQPLTLNTPRIINASTVWRHSIEELMAWLGWADQWAACNPGCGPEELCWIPIWPLTFMTRPSERRAEGMATDALENLYEEPRPPYGGPRRPGYGHGRPPPGFGHDDENMLWEPQCVNRTRMLLDFIEQYY